MSAKLHRWTDAEGQEWACAAYDHGPFCRLCQRVDDTTRAIFELLDAGDCEITGADKTGDLLFRLTPKGEARAVELINGLNPNNN